MVAAILDFSLVKTKTKKHTLCKEPFWQMVLLLQTRMIYKHSPIGFYVKFDL